MKNLIGLKTLLKRELQRMLKVPFQTFFPPLISSLMFILIFGFFIGNQISEMNGTDFKQFFLPGLILMHVIMTAYSNTGFSLFLKRFLKDINDLLVTPLSYRDLVLGILLGGVMRALLVGISIYLVGVVLVQLPLHNVFLFAYFLFFTAFIFSAIGALMGLMAESFEHVEILSVFLLTPLTFLGGVFHSVKVLPLWVQQATALNPIFYLIDGLRYSIIGKSDGDIYVSLLLVFVLAIVLFYVNMHLFKKGWKLRT